MTASSNNESGVAVYPRLPVPAARREEPRERDPAGRPVKAKRGKGWIALLIVGMAAGGAAVWFGRPLVMPDPEIGRARAEAAIAKASEAQQKLRAEQLEKSLDATAKGKREVEDKLTVAAAAQTELAGKEASAESQKKAAEGVQAKLRAAVDKSFAAVIVQSDGVHVQIADRVLWKPNDDVLTDRGKQVLNKLAATLRDMPDRVVWVQGHTDDQPVPLPKAPPPAPAKKGAKPAAAAAPVARFPTNWELAAARALSVVHYLQDTAKLEPGRLMAQAFGQYAPISKHDRAANRRLELVVAAKTTEPKPKK